MQSTTDVSVPSDQFHQLVDDLRRVLGPSSGIDSADVDPVELQALMQAYTSSPMEWDMYAFGDVTRSYTRNLIDRGNGRSNLLILVWSPGKGSQIHDHANSHCIMKILKGHLKETIYDWPDKNLELDKGVSPLVIKSEMIFGENEVTYIADTIGLHKVENVDPEEYAVSLHLYTPPNAARYGCQTFNEKTGAASHVQQCNFYSELGQKL